VAEEKDEKLVDEIEEKDLEERDSLFREKMEERKLELNEKEVELSDDSEQYKTGNDVHDGLLVLVKIAEEVNIEQDHDANVKLINFEGTLNVENPSSVDRIWDIELNFKDIENTDIKSSEINILELGTDEDNKKYLQDFQLVNGVKNQLLVKEYINTLPNSDDMLNYKDIETDLLKLRDNIISIELEPEKIEEEIEEKEEIITEKEIVEEIEEKEEIITEKEIVEEIEEKEETITEKEIVEEIEEIITEKEIVEEIEEKEETITEKEIVEEIEEKEEIITEKEIVEEIEEKEETKPEKEIVEEIEEKEETKPEQEKVEEIEEKEETKPEQEKVEEIEEKEEIITEKEIVEEIEEKEETKPEQNTEVENRLEEWVEQFKKHRKTTKQEDKELEESEFSLKTEKELGSKKDTKEEDKKEDFFEGNYSEDGGIDVAEYNIESLRISMNRLNNISFVIGMRNLISKSVNNIKVIKNVPAEFENLEINHASIGNAKIEENQLIWTIEELSPDTSAFIKFNTDIQVNSLDPVNSGDIDVFYSAAASFTGSLEIENFEGLTRNKFFIDMIEGEEQPGIWECKLVFENPSEFKLELYNADVYSPEDKNTKFVYIDPNNAPILLAGAKWYSNTWQYESKEYPSFNKKLDFRVLPNFQTKVESIININETRFILASIGGEVIYKVADNPKLPAGEETKENIIVIPSFKKTNIIATLKVVNNGSSPLNEVILEHGFFSETFQPPNTEEIKLFWNDKEVELSPETIIIKENSPKSLVIVLKDLRNSSLGMFEPNSVIEVQHPIHVIDPPRDTEFEPEVIYRANTYPLGQEIEYRPEPEDIPKIKVVHIRRKYRIGKEVIPIGDLGNYKIILSVENIGNSPLKEFILMDKILDSFEYGNYSTEPEITDEVRQDTLKWGIKTLEVDEKIEISYEITGKGEYSPSDAQVAL